MKPLVIYHGNCADGFTAAWLANLALGHKWEPGQPLPESENWLIDVHPGVYGQPFPDVEDREVYILDFSYPRALMLEMGALAESITIIDHHQTTIDDLQALQEEFAAHNLCPLDTWLDMSRSGAYLTSQYFWPEQAEPMDMVKLVDDRDRWQFQDKRSRPFHASLFSRPYKIGEWNRLCCSIDEAVAEGHAIERKSAKDIEELLDVCTRWETIGPDTVPGANLPYIFASDAGAALLARHPEAPFALTWFLDKDGTRVVSLRSRSGSDIDVGSIAKSFGGGGHKHASGFRILAA